MQFSIEHKLDVEKKMLTIHINGEFKGINVFDFEKDLLSEIRSGKARHVDFDLSKVTYVDSAAIEFLFNCAKICKESGQALRLTHPQENICGFSPYFAWSVSYPSNDPELRLDPNRGARIQARTRRFFPLQYIT